MVINYKLSIKYNIMFLNNIKLFCKLGACDTILGGHFNLIRNVEEKKGGIRNLNPTSVHFNELIDTLDLIDVRISNSIFT